MDGYYDLTNLRYISENIDRQIYLKQKGSPGTGAGVIQSLSLLRGGLELVPARSHKPNYTGSNPVPATFFKKSPIYLAVKKIVCIFVL